MNEHKRQTPAHPMRRAVPTRHGKLYRWLSPWRIGFLLFAQLLAVFPVGAQQRDLSDFPALKAHAGKVVLLDFWASWCAPCRQSFPWMSAMQKRFGRERFVVVAVNLDQDKAKAARFLQMTQADFQILYDDKGELATKLGVQAMPTSYLFDGSGRQRAMHKGFRDAVRAAREREIENLLKKDENQ